MALTLTNLIASCTQAVGADAPTGVDYTQTVNEACRFMFSMHPWRFLNRPPATIAFVDAQAYAALPSDFGEIVTMVAGDNYAGTIRLTSFTDLALKRSMGSAPSGLTWAAVVQPTQTNATSTMGEPRLELWPTPSADATDAIQLWYRAEWVELSSSNVPNIPVYAESLLVELCRAFALGYADHDVGTVSARVGEIQAGPIFAAAVKSDLRVTPDINRGAVPTSEGRP